MLHLTQMIEKAEASTSINVNLNAHRTNVDKIYELLQSAILFAAGCAYRQVVAVAAGHSVTKRLPLYGELAGADIHHVDILGAVDWI